ncbi:N-acetylmuramoyl-L-alanine amidase [Crossiella sp. NPDC003009]
MSAVRRHLALGAAFAVLGALLSPVSATAAPADRQDAFTAAATEFGVPPTVLLGVGYLLSRWDANAGEPSRGAGFGPLHLTDARGLGVAPDTHHGDGAEDPRGDTARPLQLPEPAPAGVSPAGLQTIDLAARLTGIAPSALRSDPVANIRGGAAVLAQYQRELGGGSAPADWYGAVARYSGANDTATARRFADEVFELLRTGTERVTDDGHRVRLAANPGISPRVSQVDGLGLRAPKPHATECPKNLGCEWVPAPYEHYDPSKPGSYGNHDQADRPRDLKIKYIIVHDTEGYYDTTLKLVQNPKYVSWQYTLRSADGHVAQHVRAEDVAWQAGNWYVNTHSIGLEHEGFAAKGTWYTEAMYRSSARLVRYLAKKYDIPLDRAHILGHDNVPGTTPATVRGMHWDPGPYWDWAHYFDLLGAPFHASTGPWAGIVTIKPDYAANHPVMYGCDSAKPADPCPVRGTTSVFLHTEPRADAPLVKDPGLRPDGSNSTRHVSDYGGRVDTGQRFAVAERRGEWTAIWYLGQQAWFHNPRAKPAAVNSTGYVVTPRPGLTEVPVFGRAYPEEAAYAGTGVPYQPIAPLQYTMRAGEKYVLAEHDVPTDYYFAQNWAGPRTVVRGKDRYYQVFFGHRAFFVKAADVRVSPSW